MQKYKGLIFDFNGVLLLDQLLHDEVWRKMALEIAGRIPSDDEFREHLHGITNKTALEYLLRRDVGPDEEEYWATRKELAYQKFAKEQTTYRLADGAAELCDELKKKNVPFTIGTSSPPMNIPFYNEMLGLDRWFDMEKIVCGDGSVRGKPAPDIYLKAAKKLGLRPEECVVIEDARLGIAAAHAAGIGYIIAIGPKETLTTLAAIEGVREVIESLAQVEVSKLF